MRIYGPNGTTLGSPAATSERTSSTGFSLAGGCGIDRARAAPHRARRRRPTSTPCWPCRAIEDPIERRKRSVQRGKGALDVLDDLKIGLLSGNFNASTVSSAAAGRRQPQSQLRGPRPRRGAVRDRVAGRSRTGQDEPDQCLTPGHDITHKFRG